MQFMYVACTMLTCEEVTWGKFNKAFTSVIHKCSYCFQTLKTMATLLNCRCKSFIKFTPVFPTQHQNIHFIIIIINKLHLHKVQYRPQIAGASRGGRR